MKINFNENRLVWDAFVAQSPQRNVFVTSKFLDSLNIKYNLVTCYNQDKIVAGTPIIFFNNTPITSVFHYTQYQGIILSSSLKQQVHSVISSEFKLLEFFISSLVNRYHELCLCQSWRFSDMRPFQWYNYHEPNNGQFKIDLHYTGILNLQNYPSFEKYSLSIRDVRRQEYKKVDKILRIIKSDNVTLLDQLHNKTFERQDIKKSDIESSLVRSIAHDALQNNYGDLRIALVNEKPISAILFLYDDRTAYYLFSATDPEFREYTPNTIIMLDMIKDYFYKGIKEIDFVGVNSPNRGDYKISYNAELKPYFICSFNKN